MTRDHLLKLIEMLTALAQGKTLQYSYTPKGDLSQVAWTDSRCSLEDIDKDHALFTMLNLNQVRVKPEPKHREWKLGEFPVGAVARRTNKNLNQTPQVIVGADYLSSSTREEQTPCAIMPFESTAYTTAAYLLKGWEWKWPHEDDTAWRVCGVPVETA